MKLSVAVTKIKWCFCFCCRQCNIDNNGNNNNYCIDDERQFKTAKRSQAASDATVLKRVFRDNFFIFRRRSKRIAFFASLNFSTCVCMQIFNFRDGHVTTFRHPSGAYICQMPDHSSQTLQTISISDSRLSIGRLTMVWGKTVSYRLCAGQSKGTLKTRKIAVLDLVPPTL